MEDLREWYDKIRQRGRHWYRNYTYGGQRYRTRIKDAVTRDQAASIVRDEWEGFVTKARQASLLRDGVIQPAQVKRRVEMTLKEACDKFVAERPKLTSMKGIKGYHKVLQAELGENTLLSSIDTPLVETMVRVLEKETVKYRDGEKVLTESTINHYLRHLRTLMRRAQRKWGVACDYQQQVLWTGDSDGDGVMLSEPDFERTTLDEDDYRRVVAALAADARPVFEFASEIGVRAANAWGLTWPQVEWDDKTMLSGIIKFAVKSKKRNRRTNKSGSIKPYPITPRIAELLREAWAITTNPKGVVFTYEARKGYGTNKYPKGDAHRRDKGDRVPFTEDCLKDRWYEACKKVGIKIRWHDATRASFATRLKKAGYDLVDIQVAMGHADISTTRRYVDVKSDRAHAIILEDAKRRALSQDWHKKSRATLKVVE
jgi:integrase